MSTFAVSVVRISDVQEIPGADQIELARVFGYQSVVRRGEFEPGDLAVYIPEASVLPNWLIEYLNLTGRLAGSDKNRVKAVRLRGCVSQGLLLKVQATGPGGVSVPVGTEAGVVKFGQFNQSEDLALALGIVKWEPAIPVHLAGEVANLLGKTRPYDIENIQRYPDVMVENEQVVILEKCHGTFTAICHWPGLAHPELLAGDYFAYSKGLGAQGLVFKSVPANDQNIYQRTLIKFQAQLEALHARLKTSAPIFLFGETFGPGIQDLHYGLTEPVFRVFDCWVGVPNLGSFLPWDSLADHCAGLFDLVPVLYRGTWKSADLPSYRDGKTTLDGSHVREGVVVRSSLERYSTELAGRMIIKAVSPAYLLRKGNTTEFQ